MNTPTHPSGPADAEHAARPQPQSLSSIEEGERAVRHTPGPWLWTDEYGATNGERTWSLVSGANGYGILSCDGLANSPQEIGGNGQADAALIAAAPELLEALQAFMALDPTFASICDRHLNEMDTPLGRAVRMARAAIAKATGTA